MLYESIPTDEEVWPGAVLHTCNPNRWEAEVGGSLGSEVYIVGST